MLKTNRFGRRVLRVVGVIFLLFLLLAVYLVWVSNIQPPKVKDTSAEQFQRTQHDSSFYTLNNNWFRKSNSGLYEMYVEGTPFQRGVINGKLSKELVMRQEDNFNDQIRKMIPRIVATNSPNPTSRTRSNDTSNVTLGRNQIRLRANISATADIS